MVPLALPPRAVLDGAMGTSLIARGLDLRREPCEAWNLDRPETVAEVHERYVAAGCDALTTNSFGGNRIRLGAFGRGGDADELNRAAAELALEVAATAGRGRTIRVLASIGPSGLLPPPEGEADVAELEDAFAEQATSLAAAGVDLFHLETFYHPKELRAALRGVRAGAAGGAVIASFTCGPAWSGSGPVDAGAGALRTPAGYPIDGLISLLVEEAADGVGVNCSIDPGAMRPIVALLARRVAAPILARPITGPEGTAPLLPGEFAAGALALFAAGAAAVGGCCGTGPADLAALRAALS